MEPDVLDIEPLCDNDRIAIRCRSYAFLNRPERGIPRRAITGPRGRAIDVSCCGQNRGRDGKKEQRTKKTSSKYQRFHNRPRRQSFKGDAGRWTSSFSDAIQACLHRFPPNHCVIHVGVCRMLLPVAEGAETQDETLGARMRALAVTAEGTLLSHGVPTAHLDFLFSDDTVEAHWDIHRVLTRPQGSGDGPIAGKIPPLRVREAVSILDGVSPGAKGFP